MDCRNHAVLDHLESKEKGESREGRGKSREGKGERGKARGKRRLTAQTHRKDRDACGHPKTFNKGNLDDAHTKTFNKGDLDDSHTINGRCFMWAGDLYNSNAHGMSTSQA